MRGYRLVNGPDGTVLFGGSFDPPHQGHSEIIRQLAQWPEIRKIIVMPAFRNPFKNRFHAPPEKRLEWCRKVFRLPKVEVSDFEISKGRPVYTIETVRELEQRSPVSHLLIGADNLATLPEWKDFETLNRTLTWIVATREGDHPDTSILRHFRTLPVKVPVSSTEIRAGRGLRYVDPAIREEVARYYHQKTKDSL